MISYIKETQNSISNQIILDNKLRDGITEIRIDLNSKFQLPKFTSLSISTILTAIWAFPETVAGHPILSRYINTSSNMFNIVWISALLITFAFWVSSYMIKRKD